MLAAGDNLRAISKTRYWTTWYAQRFRCVTKRLGSNDYSWSHVAEKLTGRRSNNGRQSGPAINEYVFM